MRTWWMLARACVVDDGNTSMWRLDDVKVVGECGANFSSRKRQRVNATQEAGENIGDCPGALDLGTVADVGEDIGEWVGALGLGSLGDVGQNIADWPLSSDWELDDNLLLSSDWEFDDNPEVGEVHGIEVINRTARGVGEQQESDIITSTTKRRVEVGIFHETTGRRYQRW